MICCCYYYICSIMVIGWIREKWRKIERERERKLYRPTFVIIYLNLQFFSQRSQQQVTYKSKKKSENKISLK